MGYSPEYGFGTADECRLPIQPKSTSTLYEECVPSYAIGSLAQLAYTITKLSYFAVVSQVAYTGLAIALLGQACKDYTFFKGCQKISLQLAEEYPLLPVILTIAAAHCRLGFPLVSTTLSILSGSMIGFSLRVKWLHST
jgi:hypothetical protein